MSVSEPSKILTPWATSGLKNTIPETANPVTGNAGFDQGFPAINMTAKEAGGIPPFGQDFNGILFAITEALRYAQAGGIPTFSAPMSTAIGGYPKGALLLGSNGVNIWQNQLDGNTTNPDSGGSNWIDVSLKILPKRTFSASDFIRIPDVPGGLIIQWKQGTIMNSGDSTQTITLPTTFPTANLFSISTTIANSVTQSDMWCQVLSANNSSVSVVAQWTGTGAITGGVYPQVIAIGY